MSDYESGSKLQGHQFKVLSGPFEGQLGVLQAVTKEMGQLAWPGRESANGIIRLWFAWPELEPLPVTA